MSDYVWLNESSQAFLQEDYLLPSQTVDERVDIICNTAEKILGVKGFAARFKANFKKGWYSLSTPIWANFGTQRGLPISCFGSNIGDSMESILETHSEVGMMTKYGGGTSAYFGKLRPRGATIRDNGESSGSVHFMSMFENLINVVSQGKVRRGNFAAYLPIDHKDIEEFLQLRTDGNPIQDLSFGVCISDAWMQSMIDGDAPKRKIWARVLQSRANSGYPFLFFTDNVNKNTVDVYKDLSLTIDHTNLCVIGNQRVVSSRGLKTAKQLHEEGGSLVLFDNEKVVTSSSMRLIEKNADVYRINLSNGMSHTVTGYHKIKTKAGRKSIDVACLDLKPGDKIAIQTTRGLFGNKNTIDEAFLLGMYQGDGTQTELYRMIDVWENDFDLLDEIEATVERVCEKHGLQLAENGRIYNSPKFSNCEKMGTCEKKRLSSRGLAKLGFQKGIVPEWIFESNEESQWAYIKGLFYTDGTIQIGESQGNPLQLSLANIDKPFLEQIQIILANLGMQTSIRLLRKATKTLLPDGHGGKKLYDSKTCYRLIIGNKNDALIFNQKTGFLDRKGVVLENREYRDNTKKFYSILNIEYVGKEDVYCCTVDSKEHHWICNGVITHNCTEVMLPDTIDESFVCDLSSMNILYYDDWKDTDAIELLTMLLDAVMTEFIKKAKKILYLHRSVKFAEKHRALGIGWLGWHSYLQSKMIPFESMKAKLLNVQIAKKIKTDAYAASAKLAEMFGEPEILKGYGRRNTTLLAIAPTKSSSFIIGQVSEGIEAAKTNYYIKDLAKGKFTIKNIYLEKLLISKDKNTDEIWTSILKNGGSVQHLDILSQDEKDVFKTLQEISPKEIIIQAAQRQPYIDQGQSLNLMIHPSIPTKDVNALIIEAWKLGVKSLYYQYSVNAAQQFSRNILSCSNCEA